MRVCSRTGCGVNLLKPDGVTPDYSAKRFCSRECKLADLRDKMRAMRADGQDQRHAYVVSRNKAPQSDATAVEGDW